MKALVIVLMVLAALLGAGGGFVVGFIALRLIPIRRAIVLAGNEPPVVI